MHQLSYLKCRLFRLNYGTKIPKEKWIDTAKYYQEHDLQQTFQGFNVGAVCGDDIIVLDIEGPKKKGCANGWPHIQALQRAHGMLPMCPTYKTPSGGGGMIFKAPQQKRIPFCDLSKTHGLELRTGAHFNLLPESYYDGFSHGKDYVGDYTWTVQPSDVVESEEEIPEPPQWLVDWFIENSVVTHSTFERTQEAALREDYLQILENNIWLIDPDCSYPQWFEVMCICERAGVKGKSIFLEWSRTAKQKYQPAETDRFIESQWSGLRKRAYERDSQGLPMLGIQRLLLMVCSETPPSCSIKNGHLPFRLVTTSSTESKETIEVTSQNPISMYSPLPLFGSLEIFRKQLLHAMPTQVQSCYAIPIICLQSVLQRQFAFSSEGLLGHWWIFAGDPGSQKTTVKNIIKDVVTLATANMKWFAINEAYESANGMKATFRDKPSQLLLMDEGLKTINAATEASAKNSFDAKIVGMILNCHNNKSDQEETQNRVKSHRIPKVKFPQMCMCTFDQTPYFERFRSSEAQENGLTGRFFAIQMFEPPETKEERMRKPIERGYVHSFARTLIKLVPERGPQLRVDIKGEPEFHTWSAVGPYDPPEVRISDNAQTVFDEFYSSQKAWFCGERKPRKAIFDRHWRAMIWLSQLLAHADNKEEVGSEHALSAAGVVKLSLINLHVDVRSFEDQLIFEAQKYLLQNGASSPSKVLNALPNRFRAKGQGYSISIKILKNVFPNQGQKILKMETEFRVDV